MMDKPDDLLSLDLVLFAIGTGLDLQRYPSGSYRATAHLGGGVTVEGFGGRPWTAVLEALQRSGNLTRG